jgi:Gly-Xaa carboxypeptidase
VFRDTLICTAAYSNDIDQDSVKKAILASITSDKALKAVESVILRDPLINALIGTTRAVDVIGGGVKS